MGNIVGKPFGVVASKDYNTALTESVKEGNQAKFYLTENGGKGFNDITATTDDSRNTLIVNGNKIQGVSTSDINKLNLISGSGLITDGAFRYKGSVKNFESLPTNANIGDVYNILDIFKIDGATYPINSCVFYFDDGNTKWHPLTDTLQIGTEGYVENRYSNLDRLAYISRDFHRPIDSFNIRLDNDSGLYAINGKIYIKLGLGLGTSDIGIKTTLGKGLMFDDNANITVNPGSGLYLGTNSKLELKLGNGLRTYNGIIQVRAGKGLTIDSNKDININPGDGLNFNTNSKLQLNLGSGLHFYNGCVYPNLGPGLTINSDNKITYKLGSSKDDNNEGDRTRCSGLYIDSSYGLNVALATDIYNTNSYISGIVRLDEQDASYGGLAIDSNVLSSWLENDTNVENHIISITRNNLRLGSGLTNSQKNDIQLNLGHCLFINGSDQIDISIGSGLINDNGFVEVSAGRGLSINSNNKKLEVSIGSALSFHNNAVAVDAIEELQVSNNGLSLNVNYLSGTEKDSNLFYYSKGGLYFANTIKSGQRDKSVLTDTSISNRKTYLQLRCGTGLAFQEGYQDLPGVDGNSSQVLGRDGRYYVNIDNTTIGLNTNSKLRVKHDSTLSESSNGLSVKVGNNLVTGDDGININLPTPTPSGLQQLPVSTAAILVNDGNNGLCVDIPALKRLVELIMAAK